MRSLALALTAALLAATAAAQTLNFNSIYGRYTTQFFTTTMFQTAEMNKRIAQLEALKRTKLPAKPPGGSPARAPLTASDFTPAGPRTVAQQLANAVAEKDRAQVLAMAESIVPTIEAVPGFRKHNLAAAMTVALGAALQVALEQDLSDESAQALTQALNDALAADPGVAKLTAEQRTQAYDAFLVTGGLMAGIYENAKETKDQALMPTAREMALATLKQFGVVPPASAKKK